MPAHNDTIKVVETSLGQNLDSRLSTLFLFSKKVQCRIFVSIQQVYLDYLPSDDDEHIESIPRFCEVRLLAVHAHRHELHKHLHAEESEDEVVEASEDLTAR